MRDFLDYIAVWLPVSAAGVMFMITALIISKGNDRIARFEKFTRIFLSDGATLKTWGLFISAFTICLLLAGVIAKIATDAAWPHDAGTAAARIHFFYVIAIGLEVMLSIVLGAFGAVAFKGQGPGGFNFQVNQDGTTANITTPNAPNMTRRPETEA